MSLLGVFLRFTGFHILLTILAGVALSVLGLKTNSGVAMGVLFGATMLSCNSFGKKNGRYFTNQEKIKVTAGFAIINFSIQFLLTVSFLKLASIEITQAILLLTIFEAGLLHSIVLYFFVGLSKKRLIREGFVNE